MKLSKTPHFKAQGASSVSAGLFLGTCQLGKLFKHSYGSLRCMTIGKKATGAQRLTPWDSTK